TGRGCQRFARPEIRRRDVLQRPPPFPVSNWAPVGRARGRGLISPTGRGRSGGENRASALTVEGGESNRFAGQSPSAAHEREANDVVTGSSVHLLKRF